MTAPVAGLWTLYAVVWAVAMWKVLRAAHRHGESQPDRERHPSGIEDLAAATGALRCDYCIWWLDDEEHGYAERFTPCPDHDPNVRTS